MTGPSEVVLATHENPGRAARRPWRRFILLAFLLFILAAFMLPLVSLGRYHRSIADSLSRSLGHTVHLGSVNLAIFPLPGLVIHDLVVEEDPSFGAEPLLRAPSVTVFPRLSSLWTQRLEISRIRIDSASVNLARDSSGRWNFSSLLLQASRTASAPTAQRRPSAALRFPYIEFSDARINFKKGYEKKAFSFFNADASVWLADPNRWRIRFEAQPVRTDLDLDLEDTGTVRLEGSLTRAPALDQLPLDLHAEWTGAQLGQVSRLIFGFDSGWRGDLRAEADITGDMQNLFIRPRLHVINAHRLEFTPINELDIDALCQATYHHPRQSLDDLTCLLPTGDGHLLLTGSVPDFNHPRPHLKLEINHTPVSFAVSLLGLLRRTLPTDLDASGIINGNFLWAPSAPSEKNKPGKIEAAAPNTLTGHAIAENVSIRLANIDQPFTFAALRFVTPNETTPSSPSRKAPPHVSPSRPASEIRSGNAVLLEPAVFAAGAPTPMQVSAQLSRSGFTLHFTGEGSLVRLQPIALDLAQLQPLRDLAPTGTAQTDLTLSGPWLLPDTLETGAAIPGPAQGQSQDLEQGLLRGWVRLQHARIKPTWLPEPIDIATATAQFGNQTGARSGSNTVTWANAVISVNGISANGSASYPAVCDNPSGCSAQVNLDFASLNAATLQSAILGASHGEFLQVILSQVESPPPPWPSLIGTIHASTFTIGPLKLTNARASLTVHANHLNLVSLDAAALGGSAHVIGSVQAASDGPGYALDLTWTGVKLSEAAAVFHEKWGTGSIDGQASLNLHGYSNLASTATGTFSWIVNGSWSGSGSSGSSALLQHLSPFLPAAHHPSQSRTMTARALSWTAAGTIANQTLSLTKGPARGTISFDRNLDLAWNPASSPAANPDRAGNAPSVTITGTVAHPVIASHIPETQSRLRPNP
jgi:hypothetical protein